MADSLLLYMQRQFNFCTCIYGCPAQGDRMIPHRVGGFFFVPQCVASLSPQCPDVVRKVVLQSSDAVAIRQHLCGDQVPCCSHCSVSYFLACDVKQIKAGYVTLSACRNAWLPVFFQWWLHGMPVMQLHKLVSVSPKFVFHM